MNNLLLQFKSNECKYVYLALILLACSVLVYSFFLYLYLGDVDISVIDPLNSTVFEWNYFEKCCSWWPISHLIAFTVLSFIFPNCWFVLFIGGIFWEIIEYVLNFILSKFKKSPNSSNSTNSRNIQYKDVWMNGSIKDIFFNTCGILLGKLLRLFVSVVFP
jgi:hypothetical protein